MRSTPLGLRDGDRQELSGWLRSSTIRAGLAQRARIVLLAADGLAGAEIARRVGVSAPTVLLWRRRYERAGVGGLADAPRAGRPKRLDDRAVIEATLTPPPKRLGVTHWSSRLLAARLKVHHASVARAWKAYLAQHLPDPLGEDLIQPGDLGVELGPGPVRRPRRVRADLRPVQGEQPQPEHPRRAEHPQHLTERVLQRRLVPGPEPGDRRVVRAQPRRDHPERDVLDAAPLDLPARADPGGVGVEQQRGHQSPGRTRQRPARWPDRPARTRSGRTRRPRRGPPTPDGPRPASPACPAAAGTADHDPRR